MPAGLVEGVHGRVGGGDWICGGRSERVFMRQVNVTTTNPVFYSQSMVWNEICWLHRRNTDRGDEDESHTSHFDEDQRDVVNII